MEGAGEMLLDRCSGCASRQARSCDVSGLDVTRATSRSKELRLQGISPIKVYAQQLEASKG